MIDETTKDDAMTDATGADGTAEPAAEATTEATTTIEPATVSTYPAAPPKPDAPASAAGASASADAGHAKAHHSTWGRDFDPDELARLETRMWKAYYRKQPARLYGLLIQALRAQARVSWPRAIATSLYWTRAAARFGNSTGDYDRYAPDIAKGYRMLGLPPEIDAEAAARHELRWWVVRREIGLAAGDAAGEAITDVWATLYDVPRERVAEAGHLRGMAAEVRDRGATDDPDGPTGAGKAYWPQVARLLRDSYRSLHAAVNATTEYE